MNKLLKDIILVVALVAMGWFIFSDVRKTTVITDNQHTIDSLKQSIVLDKDSIRILRLEASAERFKADSLAKVAELSEREGSVLKQRLDSILGTIDSIPPTENYAFLKDTAYPVVGEGEYPFNDNQLKLIRRDYEISKASYDIIANKDTIISLLKGQNNSLTNALTLKELEITKLNNIIKTNENLLSEEKGRSEMWKVEATEQKTKKKIYAGATIGTAILLIISIL